MNNADMPAMPVLNENAFDEYIEGTRSGGRLGMTKREYFAGLAMQAILANPNENSGMENAAFSAVYWADELLAELERAQ